MDWSSIPEWAWGLLFASIAIWTGRSGYQAFRKGQAIMPRGGGIFYRDKQPTMFWVTTALTAFYFMLFAGVALFFAREALETRIAGGCTDPSESGDREYYLAFAAKCDAPLSSIWRRGAPRNRLYADRGYALYNAGEYRRALDDFSHAISIDPADQWSFYMRGLSYAQLGKAKEAGKDYDAAIRIEPDYWKARRQRAALNLDMGQASKAIEDLNRLAAATPKDAIVFRLLGLAQAMKGQCDAASRAADKALSLGDASPWPFMAKGECFAKSGQLEAALDAYDVAIKRSPRDPRPYLARSDIDFRNKKYDEAIDDVSRALQSVPENPSLLYRRCWFRALSNRQIEAGLYDCNKGLDSEPDSPLLLETRALILFRLERYAAAEADCTRTLGKFPNSVTALYVRGLARKKLGNPLGDSDIAAAGAKSPGDVASLAEFDFTP
jgi:tetratricopeptide (TPR) repeat protein